MPECNCYVNSWRLLWLFENAATRHHEVMSLTSNALLKVEHAVRCQSGLLWVTREGDSHDYLLGPGEELTGRMLVQALRPSEVFYL